MSRRRELTVLLSLLTPARLPRGRSTVLPPESPVLGLQPGVTARRAVLAPRLTTLPTQAFPPSLPPAPTSAPALTFSLFREALPLLCEGHTHASRPRAPATPPLSPLLHNFLSVSTLLTYPLFPRGVRYRHPTVLSLHASQPPSLALGIVRAFYSPPGEGKR